MYLFCSILLDFPTDAFLPTDDFPLEVTNFDFLTDGVGDLYIPIFLCFDSIVSGCDLSFINYITCRYA